MADDPAQPSLPERAFDSLTDARRAVLTATEEVVEVGRHFCETVEAAKQPNTYVRWLEELVRAAPLPMLGITFVAGVMFAAGRRRRD